MGSTVSTFPPYRAPIMSTCPIELNDDGAADPASDSTGPSADLAA